MKQLMKTTVGYGIGLITAMLLGSALRNTSMLASECPGFFAAGAFGVGTNPISIAVGDFNRDNKSDLAVANQQSENVSVLLGKGDGTFEMATNFAAGFFPQSVAVADLN